MAIELTAEQEAIVQGGRRNDDELPYYFDSVLRTRVQISRDFEAFLILAPTELKNTANQWIKEVASLQKVNRDRDELVSMALNQERTNAQARIAALDEKLQGFDAFRQNFSINNTFATIPEIQKFTFDMQRVVEEMTVARERYEFDNIASQVVERNYDSFIVTDPQIEQLQSWSEPLSEYLRS